MPFTPHKQIKTMQDVKKAFIRAQKYINSPQLSHFELFHHAYQIVMQEIDISLQQNYFNNPNFIEKFAVCFAKYYLGVLESTYKHQKVASAWEYVQSSPKNPQFVCLLLGANAHINHDLPLAFMELLEGGNPNELLVEVFKIDKILLRSGKKIILSYKETNKIHNFIKNKLFYIYFYPIMGVILWWRIKAWRSYETLKNKGKPVYQTRSKRTARRIALFSKVIF